MILLPNDTWQVKHTQAKGKGIFATQEITPGTIISDYLGRVIKTAEEDTSERTLGLYLMYYHDYASIYPLDITAPGAHSINHSCTPNAWIFTYKGHSLFFALRKIFAGEEITISYLLPPDTTCQKCTHICLCESMFCTHTMHLSQERFHAWNTFSEKQARQTKRARIRYGQALPKLTEYPQIIPDHAMYALYGNLEQEPHVVIQKELLPIAQLRSLIRQTGRTIFFPNLQTKIFGVANNEIIIAERRHDIIEL